MKTKKCTYYQKQLHLYRSGELSDRERDRLNRHLASCPDCAAIRKELADMDHKIEQLRGESPVPDKPEALTGNIMHVLTSYEKLKSYQEHSTYDNLIKFVFAPRIRFALLAVIVVIVGLFFIQESLLMVRIARLEKKISQNTAAGINRTGITQYFVLENKLLSLEKSGLFPSGSFLTVNNIENEIVTNEKLLNALLENYKSIKIQNELLLQLLKNTNPDFFHITLKDGLDRAEIEKLLRNKKEILRLIKEL
ncbi:zf-HC2 domain-containing protein [candidate division KSB1 bacterium]|nr:zf-HC2 domain-containing protein [candidate division KSB1 bacterium]